MWDEACNTIVYLHNISPHQILGTSRPEEDFSRKRTDRAHFGIFGSLVYYHVTKDTQKKIEATTEFGIFLGYTDTPHNYQVYLPTNRMEVV